MQALVSFDRGFCHVQAPELIHSLLKETLVWLRVPGNILVAGSAMLPIAFPARLEWGGRSARSAALATG